MFKFTHRAEIGRQGEVKITTTQQRLSNPELWGIPETSFTCSPAEIKKWRNHYLHPEKPNKCTVIVTHSFEEFVKNLHALIELGFREVISRPAYSMFTYNDKFVEVFKE